jgi:hypothetical protein
VSECDDLPSGALGMVFLALQNQKGGRGSLDVPSKGVAPADTPTASGI